MIADDDPFDVQKLALTDDQVREQLAQRAAQNTEASPAFH